MKQVHLTQLQLDDPTLASFCGQMSLILRSGISAFEGISIMKEDAEQPEARQLFSSIEQTLEMTGSLSLALTESHAFPPYLCHMTELGEQTGNLDTVMEALEAHYNREHAIKQARRSALIYPLILSTMMIVVILVLLIRVMPIFQQVFQELGTTMTGLPLTLMQIGMTIKNYAVIFLLLLFCAIVFIVYLNGTKRGRRWAKQLGSHISFIRDTDHAVAACRFASNMALSLSSGLMPEEGLTLARSVNEDERFGEQLKACQADLEQGMDLSETLYQHHIFSGIYSHMMKTGYKTGSLDQVLQKIAEMYQSEIDVRLNNRLAILEPVLVITLCAAVGTILLSVMFPLLGIMGSL